MNMGSTRKTDLTLSVILPGILLVFALMSYMGKSVANFGDSYVLATIIVCMIAVSVAPVLRYLGVIRMPYWFIAIITSDIYIHAITLYFGTYQTTIWWDRFTHFYSSLVVSMIVFIGLCILDKYILKIDFGGNALFLAMVFFCGYGFGNLWEIFEWTIDTVFGNAFMQYSVFDTLGDVTIDAAGALAMVVVGAVVLYGRSPADIISDIGLDDRIDNLKARWIAKYGE